MIKSTLIKDFLAEWPNYGFEVKTYRDILIEKELPHSKETTKETQKAILEYMTKTLNVKKHRGIFLAFIIFIVICLVIAYLYYYLSIGGSYEKIIININFCLNK